jgi:hypothetical protein
MAAAPNEPTRAGGAAQGSRRRTNPMVTWAILHPIRMLMLPAPNEPNSNVVKRESGSSAWRSARRGAKRTQWGLGWSAPRSPAGYGPVLRTKGDRFVPRTNLAPAAPNEADGVLGYLGRGGDLLRPSERPPRTNPAPVSGPFVRKRATSGPGRTSPNEPSTAPSLPTPSPRRRPRTNPATRPSLPTPYAPPGAIPERTQRRRPSDVSRPRGWETFRSRSRDLDRPRLAGSRYGSAGRFEVRERLGQPLPGPVRLAPKDGVMGSLPDQRLPQGQGLSEHGGGLREPAEVLAQARRRRRGGGGRPSDRQRNPSSPSRAPRTGGAPDQPL